MNGKYLTLRERLTIETMLKLKHSKKEIAKELNCCLTTIYNEIKRGTCVQIINDKEKKVYLADYAQTVADKKQAVKGRPNKIASCPDSLRLFIEECIGKNSFSPDVTAFFIQKNKDLFNGYTLCTRTIYNYLDKNLFQTINNNNLIVKSKRKEKKTKEKKISYREKGIKYNSIEDRPLEAKDRQTFGHWEMDTIYSGREGTKTCGLVLTERKTRFELIYKIADRTMHSVQNALDKIQQSIGGSFSQIFKTISVDNGVEFSQPDKIEFGSDGKRTNLYYCHAYCSGERGSNENINRMIRWFFPKGSDLGEYTEQEFASVMDWLNDYPRRLLNYQTPKQLVQNELVNLGINISTIERF